MKNLKLNIMLLLSMIVATFRRTDALALGNTNDNVTQPTVKPEEDADRKGQQRQQVDLAAENAALKAKLYARSKADEEITKLTRVGLTHAQAVASVRNKAKFAQRSAALKKANK